MTTLSYDNKNFPSGITTSRAGTTFQQLGMVFNSYTGNLSSRSDLRRGLSESFTYDNLDRLEQSQVAGLTALEMDYADNGNISYKSDAGEYDYDPLRTHAVTSVSSNEGPTPFPLEQQDITYTPFQSVKTITEGNNSLSIQYGPDRQRRRMVTDRDWLTTTTLYGRNYERVTSGSEVKHYHYIGSPTGLAAILINGQVYFPLSDHLGSITGLVSSTTYTLVEEYSYDPWGRRRNPDNWSYENVPVSVYLTRGYTGHSLPRPLGEHLDLFGLINMNGRMYDPLLGRFLSPDNYVQNPYGTQGFNRFGYCLNNPLKYTDPEGEFPFLAMALFAVAGAYIGGASAEGWEFNPGNWAWDGDTWAGIGLGAVIGAAGGIGFGYAAPALAKTAFFAHFGVSGTIGAYTITGAAAGATVGYGSGFSGGMLYSNGNWGYSHQSGIFGAQIGGTAGSMIGAVYGFLTPEGRERINGMISDLSHKEMNRNVKVINSNSRQIGNTPIEGLVLNDYSNYGRGVQISLTYFPSDNYRYGWKQSVMTNYLDGVKGEFSFSDDDPLTPGWYEKDMGYSSKPFTNFYDHPYRKNYPNSFYWQATTSLYRINGNGNNDLIARFSWGFYTFNGAIKKFPIKWQP